MFFTDHILKPIHYLPVLDDRGKLDLKFLFLKNLRYAQQMGLKKEKYTTRGLISNEKQSSFKELGLGSRKLLIFTFLIFNILILIKRKS